MAGDNNSRFVYRPLLTNMSIRRGLGESGVGLDLAPRVNSSAINGVYLERDRQRVGSVDPKRAPGEFVKRTNTSRGQLKSFLTVDRSIIKTVPFELVEGQQENQLFGELENAAGEALAEIQQAHELDVEALLWGATEADFNGIYGSGNVIDVATDRTAWDLSGAEIRKDVKDQVDTVYTGCGFMPNTVVITNEVMNTIASDPNNEIGERLKYTQGRVPTASILAQYFDVERVIVPRSLEDNANVGQTANYQYLWNGDNVGVFYIDPRDTRNKDTLASTFVWDNSRKPFLGTFTRYNEDNESWEAKVSAYYDEELIDSACGSILFNVLS